MMGRFDKHVIVVGSARSGTSWLAELLARPYRYRLLFEPEHEFQTPKGYLLCDKWMTNREEAGKAHSYLKKVFKNRVDNNWIAQHSNRKWKRHLWPFIPKRFVIKFVRCNLSAKYMNHVFGIPVIHVVRDPFEVIASQQRVKFPWLYDLNHFENQKDLVALVKKEFNYDISQWRELSPTEILALRWALENCLPLKNKASFGTSYKVVSHQKLRNDPALFRSLAKEVDFDVVDQLDSRYGKPSSKAHAKGLKGEFEEEEVQQLERQEIQQILDAFNFEEYVKPWL